MVHVVLAGGGSAGHTSPLIATAQRLLEHDGVSVSALGTVDKLEAELVPAAGIEIDFIPRVPMPRSISADLFKLPGRLKAAVQETSRILQARHADVVVGFGGYVCPPAYLAAQALKIPYLVHEGNAVPGLANKLGARRAAGVAASFPNTKLPKAQFVGLPLRKQLVDLDRAALRADARQQLGLPEESTHRPTLLVSGGSLGAQSINQAMVLAAPEVLAAGVDVLHVWGKKNFAQAPDNLLAKVDSDTAGRYVALPYVEDMTLAYAACDLMLCRSGSNTVMETATVGMPAVFVPLPHGNGEQALNAQMSIHSGAARLVLDAKLDAPYVINQLVPLVQDAKTLTQMSTAGRNLIQTDPATKLAEWILEVAHRAVA